MFSVSIPIYQCDPADLPTFWKARNKAQVIIAGAHIEKTIFNAFSSQHALRHFCCVVPQSAQRPSAPFVLFQKTYSTSLLPLLTYLREGFWWGFVGACIRENISIYELPMHHQQRLAEIHRYIKQKIFQELHYEMELDL